LLLWIAFSKPSLAMSGVVIRPSSITYLGTARFTKRSADTAEDQYWHQGSITCFRILYQDVNGLGAEVKCDGENADVVAPR
jgi:hypothetical protein